MRRKKTDTTSVGVCIALDVMEYLKALEHQYGCSRSFLINSIVREHAAQKREDDRGPRPTGSSPQLSPVIQI
jgi:hypothetical protein